MKKLCLIIAAVLLLTCFCSCSKGGLDPKIDTIAKTEDGIYYYESNKIKTMTMNLCDTGMGENSKESRLPRIEKVLSDNPSDIIGFQEVDEYWQKNLIENKLEEKYLAFTMYSYEKQKGSSVLWKKDKFELLDSGRFWYADHPDTFSKWPDAENYSIVVWVKLKEKTTGQEMFFFNTQVEDKEDIRDRIDYVLIPKVKEICKDTPYFFVGDFGISSTDQVYKKLQEVFKDVGAEKKKLEGTYHYFGNRTGNNVQRSDYIFAKPGVISHSYNLIKTQIDGQEYSNHYALTAEHIITTHTKK